MDPFDVVERLTTEPLVVAVEALQDGRWWPGRVAEWRKDSSGWEAHFLAEREAYKAGAHGGWLPIGEVRPAQHEVRTTHGGWQWGTYEPPTWPADLAQFATASNNETQRSSWTKQHP